MYLFILYVYKAWPPKVCRRGFATQGFPPNSIFEQIWKKLEILLNFCSDMFFVIFESVVPSPARAISSQYYATLQSLLQLQSGFISEVPFVSLIHEGGQVLVAKFVDEAAVQSWRLQTDHLRIQKRARQHIFESYRIRVGPEILAEEKKKETKEPTTGMPGPFILLYQYPTPRDINSSTVSKLSSLVNQEKPYSSEILADLVDSAMYQSEQCVLWLASWPTEAAAINFKDLIRRVQGDAAHLVRVMRDYGKLDRKEAPKAADEAQDEATLTKTESAASSVA